MSTLFVTRHPGAIEWMRKQSIQVDKWLDHLSLEDVKVGDTVIGILPVGLAYQVCAKGAKFVALEMSVTKQQRGTELGAAEMEELKCSLVEYVVSKP